MKGINRSSNHATTNWRSDDLSGISADVVRNFLRQPVKALILRSYGVGNAPQNKAFLQELQEASDRGIVVVNLTQRMSGKVNMVVMPPVTPSPMPALLAVQI